MKEGKRKEGKKEFLTELTFGRISSDRQVNNERSVRMRRKDSDGLSIPQLDYSLIFLNS